MKMHNEVLKLMQQSDIDLGKAWKCQRPIMQPKDKTKIFKLVNAFSLENMAQVRRGKIIYI